MKNERIILAGGSGFLGSLLAQELISRGREVIVLSRNPSKRDGPIKEMYWDGRTPGAWVSCVDGAAAVVNLAGRNVNCRYTPENRREINESRVNSVKVVNEAIRRCAHPPRVLVQTSSLAIYGDAGDRWCSEDSPPGQGFPVETCRLWEGAFNEAPTPATRRVLLRISFVLGKTGGALDTLSRLTRWGLGGRIGDGRQYISWIHWADMNGIFMRAIENEEMEGVYNATGPEPVTNAQFMAELRRALHRPWSPPVPTGAVHVGSWLMRSEPCLALTGRRGEPKRLLGFAFKFAQLHEALAEIFG